MLLRITLGQPLHDCATRFGGRTCITVAPSCETPSYAGLESFANDAAQGFRDGIAGGVYGSTDSDWVVVPQWDHPGGIVLPHYEVAVVDENNDLLPPGKGGEMVIRSRDPGSWPTAILGCRKRHSRCAGNFGFTQLTSAASTRTGCFIFTAAWPREPAFAARLCQVSRSRRERCPIRKSRMPTRSGCLPPLARRIFACSSC